MLKSEKSLLCALTLFTPDWMYLFFFAITDFLVSLLWYTLIHSGFLLGTWPQLTDSVVKKSSQYLLSDLSKSSHVTEFLTNQSQAETISFSVLTKSHRISLEVSLIGSEPVTWQHFQPIQFHLKKVNSSKWNFWKKCRFQKKYSNCLEFHVKLKICGPVSQCVEPVVAFAMPPWFPGILTVCLPLFWRRSQFSSPNNSSFYSNFTKFSNQNSQRMKMAKEWRERFFFTTVTWWFVE